MKEEEKDLSSHFLSHPIEACLEQQSPENGRINALHLWTDTFFLSDLSKSQGKAGLPRWQSGKEATCQCRRCGFNPWVQEDALERKWQPAPVLYGRIPWTEEPGELQSMGLQRVGHDCVPTHTYRVMHHQCCSHVATTAQAKSLQVLVALLVLSLDTFPTFLRKTVQELMSF